jgi:hypothetical protein
MKSKLSATLTCLLLAGALGFTGCGRDAQEDSAADGPPAERKFYYAGDGKIYLDEVENKFVVAYHAAGLSGIEDALSNGFKVREVEWHYFNSFCIVTVEASQRSTFRTGFIRRKDVRSVHPLYAAGECEMALTDEFVVKYAARTTQREIDELGEKHGVTVRKVTELYQLLAVPAGADALETANAYQESGLVEYSHPNFYAEIVFFKDSAAE